MLTTFDCHNIAAHCHGMPWPCFLQILCPIRPSAFDLACEFLKQGDFPIFSEVLDRCSGSPSGSTRVSRECLYMRWRSKGWKCLELQLRYVVFLSVLSFQSLAGPASLATAVWSWNHCRVWELEPLMSTVFVALQPQTLNWHGLSIIFKLEALIWTLCCKLLRLKLLLHVVAVVAVAKEIGVVALAVFDSTVFLLVILMVTGEQVLSSIFLASKEVALVFARTESHWGVGWWLLGLRFSGLLVVAIEKQIETTTQKIPKVSFTPY